MAQYCDNVAASATRKVSVPSRALAATFHNSFSKINNASHEKANSLESLLVYSPSGRVAQHQPLPSMGVDPSGFSLKTGPSHFCNEDVCITAEPVQCWNVCRRANWPEREGGLLGITFDKFHHEEIVMDDFDDKDKDAISSMNSFSNDSLGKEFEKNHERPHWYLANAEVQ